MKYSKPPIDIDTQIKLLSERGLKFDDVNKAKNYLSNISYYRLRAYTYPFQDNNDPSHPFIVSVTFEEIIKLYVFDRKLRLLIFDAIEKIEIALRTQIIYNFSLPHGSFWHHDPQLFRNTLKFAEHLDSLNKEVDRSKETFISHYQDTYTSPAQPPCWMALEVSSMGLLAKMFQNIKRSPAKKAVTKSFGLKDETLLENWMFCFCNLRNICAHHGRVWNRRLIPIQLPVKPDNDFLDNLKIYPNKLYATLCCIEYVLKIISPTSMLKDRLKGLMATCPMMQAKEMGFPKNWEQDNFWK